MFVFVRVCMITLRTLHCSRHLWSATVCVCLCYEFHSIIEFECANRIECANRANADKWIAYKRYEI